MSDLNLFERINKALDEVRPFLQQDGGDVTFVKVTADFAAVICLEIPSTSLVIAVALAVRSAVVVAFLPAVAFAIALSKTASKSEIADPEPTRPLICLTF